MPKGNPSWTRAPAACQKSCCPTCDTWDKAMSGALQPRTYRLANNWLSQDEENPRNSRKPTPSQRTNLPAISLTILTSTSGGSITAWFDCDEMFTVPCV